MDEIVSNVVGWMEVDVRKKVDICKLQSMIMSLYLGIVD